MLLGAVYERVLLEHVQPAAGELAVDVVAAKHLGVFVLVDVVLSEQL